MLCRYLAISKPTRSAPMRAVIGIPVDMAAHRGTSSLTTSGESFYVVRNIAGILYAYLREVQRPFIQAPQRAWLVRPQRSV